MCPIIFLHSLFLLIMHTIYTLRQRYNCLVEYPFPVNSTTGVTLGLSMLVAFLVISHALLALGTEKF